MRTAELHPSSRHEGAPLPSAATRGGRGILLTLLACALVFLALRLTEAGGASDATGQSQTPVTDLLLARLPAAAALAIATTLLAGFLGVAVGLFAVGHGGWVDRVARLVLLAGHTLPVLWVALILPGIFAAHLALFPQFGYVPFERSVAGWLASIAVPAAALTLGSAAAIARHVRADANEVLRTDYIRTLRSRGLSTAHILRVHVLRNSAPAGLTLLSFHFAGLFGGVIIIEAVFALAGFGVPAARSGAVDTVPAILGIVAVVVAVTVAVHLVVESVRTRLTATRRAR